MLIMVVVVMGLMLGGSFNTASAYVLRNGDVGWDGSGLGAASLTYHYDAYTADMTQSAQRSEILDAMNEWSAYVQVSWTETATSGLNDSIDIVFGAGNHGDAYPFDGPGGVLAHAFYPDDVVSNPIAGDMHFDDAETWSAGGGGGTFDLFTVALHELGHSLGLKHSLDSGSVMYAYYQVVTGLTQDDIDGIQSIYASTQAVPEPSTMRLLGFGLIGMFGYKKKKS